LVPGSFLLKAAKIAEIITCNLKNLTTFAHIPKKQTDLINDVKKRALIWKRWLSK
jgi:hypothetical protein